MLNCNYCETSIGENQTGKCLQCGAAVPTFVKDFRVCPNCQRKLLSMSSLACNHCGQSLPKDYIETRQNIARAIAAQNREVQMSPGLLGEAEADLKLGNSSLLTIWSSL